MARLSGVGSFATMTRFNVLVFSSLVTRFSFLGFLHGVARFGYVVL